MTGFILWIGDAWHKFYKQSGFDMDMPKSDEVQRLFDKWLKVESEIQSNAAGIIDQYAGASCPGKMADAVRPQ